MKALFVVAVNIEANASAGAETINIYIDEFSLQGVQVDVIAKSIGRYEKSNITYHLLREKGENKELGKLAKLLGWVVYPQYKYLYKTSRRMRMEIFKKLNAMKEQGYCPDVIFLETTSVLLLYREIKNIYPKAVLVASMHDVAYQGSERRAILETSKMKNLIRKRYLKPAKQNEINALKEVDLIVPHNKENVVLLKKESELVDKKYFPLVPYYERGFHHNDGTTSEDILFYGLMSRPENYESALWFIEKVMNKISGGYRFIVMGGKPPKHLLSFRSERVIITGFVDEDKVGDYFEKAMCFVAPLLHGSGIKTKVLSAFAAGLPVLTNSIGIEGIEAEKGHNYIHCETAEEYIHAIYGLSGNKDEYHALCNHAREVVEKGYNHHECAKKYLALLERDFLNRS